VERTKGQKGFKRLGKGESIINAAPSKTQSPRPARGLCHECACRKGCIGDRKDLRVSFGEGGGGGGGGERVFVRQGSENEAEGAGRSAQPLSASSRILPYYRRGGKESKIRGRGPRNERPSRKVPE